MNRDGQSAFVQADRRCHVRDVCEKYMSKDAQPTIRFSGTIWTYENRNMYYCYVPKVGCTRWKQIMKFIAGDYPKTLQPRKPSEISRSLVHLPPRYPLKEEQLCSAKTRGKMSKNYAFLFVRHPFARLWSAYIDKIFLPEFWHKFGRDILQVVNDNKDDTRQNCGNGVTFTEFLKYITLRYDKSLNEHWEPIANLCAPCAVKYDFIGKMESFVSDTKELVRNLDIKEAIEYTKEYNHIKHAVSEMTMLTKYNFALTDVIYSDCLNLENVARNLWTSFQYNGYIYREYPIPWQDMLCDNVFVNTSAVFLKYALKALEDQESKDIDVKTQKHDYLKEAYSAVPLEVVEKLKVIYRADFEIFGYNYTL